MGRKNVIVEETIEPQFEGVTAGLSLVPGFYLVDGLGRIKCKPTRKRIVVNGEKSFVVIDEPIRLRTIAAAKDFCACSDGLSVLCVVLENFAWGE